MIADTAFEAERRGLSEGYFVPSLAAFADDSRKAELLLKNNIENKFEAALLFLSLSVTVA